MGGIGDRCIGDDAKIGLKNAMNICDFAVCVREAVKQVISPVDGKPIELRIGIHTGSAVTGVAGY